MTNSEPITLQALFRYYKGLPHQAAAIKQLEEDLIAHSYGVALRRDRPWFNTWSQDGKQIDLGPAIKLIQQFEGLQLDAYLCPAGNRHDWLGYPPLCRWQAGKAGRQDQAR
jgi:hypothetical protein